MKDSMVYKATLDMSQRRATRKAIEEALEDIPSLKDTFSTADPYLLSFKDELNKYTKKLMNISEILIEQ